MSYSTKTISYEVRSYVFWAIASLIVCFAASYIFAINSAIRNTALRQNLETEVAALTAKQSSLEFAYIEQKNKINIDLAYEQGFKEVSNPVYVSLTSGNSFTYNR